MFRIIQTIRTLLYGISLILLLTAVTHISIQRSHCDQRVSNAGYGFRVKNDTVSEIEPTGLSTDENDRVQTLRELLHPQRPGIGLNRLVSSPGAHRLSASQEPPFSNYITKAVDDVIRKQSEEFKASSLVSTLAPTTESAVIGLEGALNEIMHPRVKFMDRNGQMPVCRRSENVSIVVVVYSAVNHNRRRMTIRNTWANPQVVANNTFKVVFLLGTTEETTQQRQLERESMEYSDIVQGDFRDSYHNLTYKGLLGFKWVAEHCPQARTVIKVDDDVFLNVFYYMNLISANALSTTEIQCQLRQPGTSPILHTGKWAVDDSVFPGLSHYPFPYCNGFFVVLPGNRVTDLYSAANNAQYVWVDDVYLFGVLPWKSGNFSFSNIIDRDVFKPNKTMECFAATEPCHWPMAYLYTDESFEEMWNYTLRSKSRWLGLGNTRPAK